MHGQELRPKLRHGDRVIGTHITSALNPVIAGMVAAMDLDFVFMCNEHMPLDRRETSMMCQFYAARGIAPIVRVPCPRADLVSMALDGGAQGIVAPYVEEVDEVRELVGAVRFRPLKGRMLDEVLSRRRKLNPDTEKFIDEFNRDTFLIVGIESMAAVENLPALLAVDGIDGVFIGPHDLSITLELPGQYNHPEFIAAVERVIVQCRSAGVGVGLHMWPPTIGADVYRRLVDRGMNWLALGADINAIQDGISEQIRSLRAPNLTP